MRVICIDDVWVNVGRNWFQRLFGLNKVPNIKFGEIVTVSDAYTDKDGAWYNFMEYGEYEYEQSAFAPLSDISETNFERNYNKLKQLQ